MLQLGPEKQDTRRRPRCTEHPLTPPPWRQHCSPLLSGSWLPPPPCGCLSLFLLSLNMHINPSACFSASLFLFRCFSLLRQLFVSVLNSPGSHPSCVAGPVSLCFSVSAFSLSSSPERAVSAALLSIISLTSGFYSQAPWGWGWAVGQEGRSFQHRMGQLKLQDRSAVEPGESKLTSSPRWG